MGIFCYNLDGINFNIIGQCWVSIQIFIENGLAYLHCSRSDSSTDNTDLLENSKAVFDLSNKIYQKRKLSDSGSVSKSAYFVANSFIQ